MISNKISNKTITSKLYRGIHLSNEKAYEERSCELAGNIDSFVNDKEMETIHQRVRTRADWEYLIIQQSPTLVMTVTFIDPKLVRPKGSRKLSEKEVLNLIIVSDEFAERTLNKFFKHINQFLFGRDRSKYLKGVGCLEYQWTGQPHMHLDLFNRITGAELLQAVDYVLSKNKNTAKKVRANARDLRRRSKDLVRELEADQGIITNSVKSKRRRLAKDYEIQRKSPRPINEFAFLDHDNLEIQDCWDATGAAGYKTKLLETVTTERMILLNKEGLWIAEPIDYEGALKVL